MPAIGLNVNFMNSTVTLLLACVLTSPRLFTFDTDNDHGTISLKSLGVTVANNLQ